MNKKTLGTISLTALILIGGILSNNANAEYYKCMEANDYDSICRSHCKSVGREWVMSEKYHPRDCREDPKKTAKCTCGGKITERMPY